MGWYLRENERKGKKKEEKTPGREEGKLKYKDRIAS